jgi:hypothetical protein
MGKAAFLSVLFAVFLPLISIAQQTEPEMADVMRSNGKIYVVVLVLATIFAGIIVYLVRLDRKISKLEKNHSA